MVGAHTIKCGEEVGRPGFELRPLHKYTMFLPTEQNSRGLNTHSFIW